MRLTEEDYREFAKSYIEAPAVDAAGIIRVSAIEGAELMGVTGTPIAPYCAGKIIPYWWPGENRIYGHRLRLDHPPIDLRTGKPDKRYLSPPGQRIHAYLPLEDPIIIPDISVPVWLAEGEKKYHALRRAAREGAALENSNGSGPKTLAMVMTFPGCWSFRGQVGIVTDAQGHRVPQKGTIPDLDRIPWKGRRVLIIYDSNCFTNEKVRASRSALARDMIERGADVFIVELLPEPGVNGPDDYLGIHGLAPFLELVKHATPHNWRNELATTDKGKILSSLDNAHIALTMAPEWSGVLGFNEFALRIEARGHTPWGAPASIWKDDYDTRTTMWLEKQGIKLSCTQVTRVVDSVARENVFHPVRDYLDSLKWDGIPRLGDWLMLYLGAKQNLYHRAVGKCWMISAVARVREPGCKADCALILENGQGRGKSTAFGILGGEFFSDDIAELGTKDASMGTAGAWIVEWSELDAMSKADVPRIKSFLSRSVDRFRPPYGRHYIWSPRQCVFCGTVNLPEYLKDATGGRRFWPVECGEFMRLDELRRDRDQLWAEAVYRYEKSEHWWLDTDELIEAAEKEQDKRFQPDGWEGLIAQFLLNRTEVTTTDVLIECVHKEPGTWRRDEPMRVADILRRLGWPRGPRTGPGRQYVYRPKDSNWKETMQFKIALKGNAS